MSTSPEKGFDWIKKQIDTARETFAQNEQAIISASEDTLAWLRRNNSYYQQDGSVKHGKWWSDLPETDNAVLADTRKFAFRCHLYENGIRRIITCLLEKGLIADSDKLAKSIDFATDYPTMGLHHELMGYKASKKNRSLTLADVSRRFSLANAVKLRDSRLVPMAELGIWECKADNTGHSITVGNVAYHFHVNTFIVLMKSFDARTGKF